MQECGKVILTGGAASPNRNTIPWQRQPLQENSLEALKACVILQLEKGGSFDREWVRKKIRGLSCWEKAGFSIFLEFQAKKHFVSVLGKIEAVNPGLKFGAKETLLPIASQKEEDFGNFLNCLLAPQLKEKAIALKESEEFHFTDALSGIRIIFKKTGGLLEAFVKRGIWCVEEGKLATGNRKALESTVGLIEGLSAFEGGKCIDKFSSEIEESTRSLWFIFKVARKVTHGEGDLIEKIKKEANAALENINKFESLHSIYLSLIDAPIFQSDDVEKRLAHDRAKTLQKMKLQGEMAQLPSDMAVRLWGAIGLKMMNDFALFGIEFTRLTGSEIEHDVQSDVVEGKNVKRITYMAKGGEYNIDARNYWKVGALCAQINEKMNNASWLRDNLVYYHGEAIKKEKNYSNESEDLHGVKSFLNIITTMVLLAKSRNPFNP